MKVNDDLPDQSRLWQRSQEMQVEKKLRSEIRSAAYGGRWCELMSLADSELGSE